MTVQAISRKNPFLTGISTFFCILLILSNHAIGETEKQVHKWEFWTGAIADLTINFESKVLSGGILGNRSSVAPSVGYLLSDQIELLIAPSFNFHTSGNYLGRIMGGVCGNFLGETIGTSFFGKVLIGFDDIFDNRRSDTIHFTLKNFTWAASVGKRFEITPHFSISPELNFTMVLEDYSHINSLSIIPLQFSLFL